MKILALDPATTTGYAFYDQNGNVLSYGSVYTKPKKQERSGKRFDIIWDLLTEYKPDVIAMEKTRFFRANFAATFIHYGIYATVELYASQNDIDIHTFTPKGLKKQFTGNGNASKDLMLHTVNAKYQALGHTISLASKDHDIADALAILYQFMEDNSLKLPII